MNSETEILSFNNDNERKRDQLQAYLLDVFFWAYTFIVFHKIFINKFILKVRYPTFSWSEPLTCLFLGSIVAAILFIPKGFSIGKRVKGLYIRDINSTQWTCPYVLFSYFIFLITFISGLIISQVSIHEFLSQTGLAGAKRIFTSLFTPNFDIFNEALFAAVETIYMAFIATVLSLPLAFLISFFAARNLTYQNPILFIVYNIIRFYMNLSRAIEPLVWAIIFSVWVGIGPFAGMLALFLHSVSSLVKLYSEQIENINNGPIEAMTATGAHPVQVVWFGVVPQVVLPFLSFTIYRWDINVRMATIIGLVGGGGIGTMLMQYQGQAKWNEVGLLVLVIASIVWAMDYTSSKIRAAIA